MRQIRLPTPASSFSMAMRTRRRGSASPGIKGFGGGFGQRALGPWGETIIKQFVREAVDEALKLEAALARLRTRHLLALLHYSPIQQTVEGEPLEIYPFLGSSRLEEPINRYPVSLVLHGHAHRGQLQGATTSGVPVYNVSMPLLTRSFSDRPPFRVFEVPAGETAVDSPPAASARPAGVIQSFARRDAAARRRRCRRTPLRRKARLSGLCRKGPHGNLHRACDHTTLRPRFTSMRCGSCTRRGFRFCSAARSPFRTIRRFRATRRTSTCSSARQIVRACSTRSRRLDTKQRLTFPHWLGKIRQGDAFHGRDLQLRATASPASTTSGSITRRGRMSWG